MIYLQLFVQFFKIGFVSFGGGYGMISLIRETVLTNHWLSESKLMAFIAVSESTPGPLAVNIATFIGASQGGILGSLVATLGVISPAFIMILVIASLTNNLLKYAGVQAFLAAVRPCVIALILATAIIMGLDIFCGIKYINDSFSLRYDKLFIFLILLCIGIMFKKIKHKVPSPILMILISAVLGVCISTCHIPPN